MTSRELFEHWYHPNFYTDPKTLAWEAWKLSRKKHWRKLHKYMSQKIKVGIATLMQRLQQK